MVTNPSFSEPISPRDNCLARAGRASTSSSSLVTWDRRCSPTGVRATFRLGTLEERHLELLLQCEDGLAQRWLRHAEPLGGAPEVQLLRYRHEKLQPTKIHLFPHSLRQRSGRFPLNTSIHQGYFGIADRPTRFARLPLPARKRHRPASLASIQSLSDFFRFEPRIPRFR